jgi:hypothetical protein
LLNEVLLHGRIAELVKRSQSKKGTLGATTRILTSEFLSGGDVWNDWIPLKAFGAPTETLLCMGEGLITARFPQAAFVVEQQFPGLWPL